MLRVLLVDDHDILRAGIKQLLVDSMEIDTVGEAGSGVEAMESVRHQDWDVVVLDMSMPGKGGMEVLKQLKKEYPNLPVLILSMHPEDQYAVRVIKAGAAGYLTKRCAADELVSAIQKVATGKKYISAVVAEKLAISIDHTASDVPHEILSDREYQIFHLLATGKQVSEIARELNLSVKTISAHRSNILNKMQMRSNAELMFYAIKNDLVSLENSME